MIIKILSFTFGPFAFRLNWKKLVRYRSLLFLWLMVNTFWSMILNTRLFRPFDRVFLGKHWNTYSIYIEAIVHRREMSSNQASKHRTYKVISRGCFVPKNIALYFRFLAVHIILWCTYIRMYACMNMYISAMSILLLYIKNWRCRFLSDAQGSCWLN